MKSSILPQLGNVTYIISGDTATESHHQPLIQALAHDLALGYFDSVTVCRGQYKGTPERSIAVTGWNSEATYECLLALGRKFGQDPESEQAMGHSSFARMRARNKSASTPASSPPMAMKHGLKW